MLCALLGHGRLDEPLKGVPPSKVLANRNITHNKLQGGQLQGVHGPVSQHPFRCPRPIFDVDWCRVAVQGGGSE